ncbi:apolipoprotein N-acyltransferase [Brevibacterium litoralis]|uniref:apolipoprotein N-acyltransferase n=1 Tax=Brevibacterium litoralis TaxID=3138935 RepID=UPI0032EE3B7D
MTSQALARTADHTGDPTGDPARAEPSPGATPPPGQALLPLWAAVPAATAAGLAMDAAFPALGWWPLAFVSVTLSLAALIGRSTWGAVLVGAIFGAAFWFPHASWVTQFLGAHPLSWVPWVALASALTIYSAVLTVPIAWAYRWLPRRYEAPAVRLLALPALVSGTWTVRELIMGSWPYGGFPWGRVGMSQSESPIAPVASWVGVSGLGFLMVALCVATIEALRWAARTRQRRDDSPSGDGEQPTRLPARWSAPIPALGLAAVMLLVPQFPTSHAGSIRVGAVQGDGPAAYVDEHEAGAVLDSQLAASAALEEEQVDIVLWPEGGVDADPLADQPTAQVLNAAADRFGAPILLNAASAEGDLVYNTSFLWTSTGPVATHAKRHPVPFGEYVPDRWFYGALVPSLVGLLQREYTAGVDTPAIDVDGVAVGLSAMIRLIWNLSIRTRLFLRTWMPTNILLDAIRTRRGLRWGIPAMLLAIPYLLIANLSVQALADNGPGWPHLVVLWSIWNALKMLWIGPVSVVLLIGARLRERAERRRQQRVEVSETTLESRTDALVH